MLLPDYQDDENDVLPSFASIRTKTLETLYPSSSNADDEDEDDDDENNNKNEPHHHQDKSPKGSVDAPIQPLIDLINQHPSFATLSSCSGRIALYDPTLLLLRGQVEKDDDENSKIETNENDTSTVTASSSRTDKRSGKGGTGGWLLTCHEPSSDHVDEDTLLKVLEESSSPNNEQQEEEEQQQQASTPLLTFKFEPMLLHVAASNLKRGQELLQLALQIGFRESGLIVTPSRVTVAIRSYSLALQVPLARQGPLRPSDDYLRALWNESCTRLSLNLQRIDRLYTEIETRLFRRHLIEKSSSCCIRRTWPMPELNLWGHATVAVFVSASAVKKKDYSADILVFGGYGTGPSLTAPLASTTTTTTAAATTTTTTSHHTPSSSRRSDKVYRLRRDYEGTWSESWEIMPLAANTTTSQEIKPSRDILGIPVCETGSWSAREGAAACVLPSFCTDNDSSTIIALFGGRRGPAQPLNDLLLLEYSVSTTTPLVLLQPLDVRGEKPSPRWGHSLSSLTGRDDKLAVLIGGRNEHDALDSIYILSMVQGDDDDDDLNGNKHLLWEVIVLHSPTTMGPRFHHATVAIGDEILVLGGLSSVDHLLESFDDNVPTLQPRAFAFDALAPDRSLQVTMPKSVSSCFGHAVVGTWQTDRSSSSSTQVLLVRTGGLSYKDNSKSSIEFLETRRNSTGWELRPLPLHFSGSSLSLDLGSMVHHSCVSVPTSPSPSSKSLELVLVGGGVAGFAFRECFAKGCRLEVDLVSDGDECQPNSFMKQDTSFIQRVYSVQNNKQAASKSQPQQQQQQHQERQQPTVSNVVYVKKQHAKALKTALEAASLLDKRVRMCPADDSAPLKDDYRLYIAVPIQGLFEKEIISHNTNNNNHHNEQPDWMQWVEGYGKQALPASSASFARRRRRQGR